MRWTLPRYRYDQLMLFGWKVLLPLASLNLLVTAAGVLYFGRVNLTLFYVFAAVAVRRRCSSSRSANPIYSVLLLIASFGALSGLYVLLDAPFVAVTQIIVYAGAIMVLFLFVVMLLNAPHEDTGLRRARASAAAAGRDAVRRRRWPGCSSSSSAGRSPGRAGIGRHSRRRPSGRCAAIGHVLFTDYAFAFEATSVLILVAMVGAVVLARREKRAVRSRPGA